MAALASTSRRVVIGAVLAALVIGAAAAIALTRDGSDGSGDGAGEGTVVGAAAQWGVRESFVGYMSGSGTITVGEGVTREPDFGWPGGTGTFDAATGTGEVQLTGAVTFAMPGHCMNELTFRNPVVALDGAGAARLLADTTVDFFSQDTGEGIDCLADPAAAIDDTFPRSHVADVAVGELTQEPQEDGTTKVTVDAAPVTLTAEASAYFNGIYAAGAEMAPLSLTVTVED